MDTDSRMPIPVRVYRRPHGKSSVVHGWVTIDKQFSHLYEKMKAAGAEITCEMLSGAHACVCIDNGEEDLACDVVAPTKEEIEKSIQTSLVLVYETEAAC